MEKLLTKMIESSIIYGDDYLGNGLHEMLASNILESPIGENVVAGVCRGIKELAKEEGKSVEEIIENILEEDELEDELEEY